MKRVLGALLVVAVVLFAIGFFLPDDVTVTRSSIVAAAPEAILEQISSLRTWPEWTIWNTESDPTVRFAFEGAERGVGARWKWKGEVFEEGQLEIVASDPGQGLRYRVTMASGLRFDGGLAFSDADGGTRVTWTDEAFLGMGPLGGWIALLMGASVDAEVGRAQEAGLAGLKARLEPASSPAAP